MAYIGLGSNVGSPAGSPVEIVNAAMESLATLGVILARSSLYRSEPVGYGNQPEFVNAAVTLRTDRDPERLLTGLLVIERSFGRDRLASVPKGPRTLDLDLLLMGPLIYESPSLVVPHPELPHRRFVLAPLTEIASEIVHPVLMRTIRELLAALPNEGPNRVDAVKIIRPLNPRQYQA